MSLLLKNWEEVCPKTKDAEICILGNPPYLGFKMQTEEQKKEAKIDGHIYFYRYTNNQIVNQNNHEFPYRPAWR
jgi:hypothetical protein